VNGLRCLKETPRVHCLGLGLQFYDHYLLRKKSFCFVMHMLFCFVPLHGICFSVNLSYSYVFSDYLIIKQTFVKCIDTGCTFCNSMNAFSRFLNLNDKLMIRTICYYNRYYPDDSYTRIHIEVVNMSNIRY
jgi:hypothetical protein